MFKSAAAALLVGAAVLVDAAHNITVYNNDTSVAYTGLNRRIDVLFLFFVGRFVIRFSWSPYTNCGGTKYTYSQGQFFTYDFTGTGIYVVGTESQEGGIVTFNLDGTTSTFDRYAVPPYRCGVPWYGKSGLADTKHTITVTFSGNSPENNTAAGTGFLEWMWLEYTVPDAGDAATTAAGATSSPLPTGTYSPAPASSTGSSSTGGTGKSSNGAAIGGGIAAAIVAVLVIAGAIWYFMRRNRNQNSYAGARPDLDPSSPRNNNFAGGFAAGMPSPGRQMAQHMEPRHSDNFGAPAVSQTTPWMPDASSAASLSPAGQPGYNPMMNLAAGAAAGGAAGAMMNQHNSNNAGYNPSVHTGSVSPSAGYAPYGSGPPSQGPFATPVSGPPSQGPFSTPPLDQQTSYSSSRDVKSPLGPGSHTGSGSGSGGPAQGLMYTANPTQEAYPANLNPTHGGFMPSPGAGTNASGGQLPESDVDRIAARVASMMGGGLPAGAARPSSPGLSDFDAPPPMYNEKR